MLREEDDQAIAGVGDKVRQLIDDHIRAYHAEQIIPPLSITDANFDAHVDSLASDRAKAAEMEHAARHAITVNIESDPVHYEKLSERLEQILTSFEQQWDALVEAMREFINDMRMGPPSDRATEFLPEQEAHKLKPFMSLLMDAAGFEISQLSNEDLQRFASLTVQLVSIIRPDIIRQDFWATPQLRQQLLSRVKVFLDDEDVLPYELLDTTADRIVELAKRRYTDLANV
jgi:type I restriction enzyme R subunit